MHARLFSKTGKTRGSELEFEDRAIIGRDPANNLVIDTPLMSSRHASIAYDPDTRRYFLEDLESLNGTALDGDPVRGRERLGHLHVITFAGTYEFFFQDVERCAQRHQEHSHQSAAAERARDKAQTAPAPKADAATPDLDREVEPESTAVDREPVALPGFLARRADAMNEHAEAAKPLEKKQPTDLTSLEKLPAILPPTLGQRADQASAEDDAGTDEKPKREVTLREKLPAVLPGNLAQRADKAQLVETLDLNDIEELITGKSDESDSDAGTEDSTSTSAAAAGTGEAEDGAPDTGKESTGLFLVVTEASGTVRKYSLVHGENFIGRSGSVEVSMAYPDLSRRHAVLTLDGENLSLRDLGSRNRTLVEDQPLDPDVETVIEPGARLRFGSVEARLVRAGD